MRCMKSPPIEKGVFCGVGCGVLPQMLKCEWRGGLPHAVQIPYAPGSGFEARMRQHAAPRRSQAQQADPAVITRSFLLLDDAELGESSPGGSLSDMCVMEP